MEREQGEVKWFNASKGYGFIGRRGRDDIFVHYSQIRQKGYKTLNEGDRVEFEIAEGHKGLQANEVELLSE